MAYPLSQILPQSAIVPHPVSPVVRDGYRRRFIAVFVGTSILWLLVFAPLGFVSVPILIESDGSVFEMIMALTGESLNNSGAILVVAIVVVLIAAGGAMAGIGSIKGYVRRWAGYRPRGDQDAREIAWVKATPLAVGAALGMVVAVVGSVFRGELCAALAWVGAAALVGYMTRHIGRRAIAVLGRFRGEIRFRDQIIAHGRHSVARVEKMHNTGDVVGGRSEFAVTLVSDHGGERTEIDVRILEYPLWAPVPGTEFDVWTTDDRTLDVADADRIIVERRYIGQDGPINPTAYRNSTGENEQRMAPKWMGGKASTVVRVVRAGRWQVLLQGFALGIRLLGTLMCASILVVHAPVLLGKLQQASQ